MKIFKGLLKSEIKKIEKATGGKCTGYYTTNLIDSICFLTVECEIMNNDMTERLEDINLNVCLNDRRMSFTSR